MLRWDGEKFIPTEMVDLVPGDIFTTSNAEGIWKATGRPSPTENSHPDGNPVLGIEAKRIDESEGE